MISQSRRRRSPSHYQPTTNPCALPTHGETALTSKAPSLRLQFWRTLSALSRARPVVHEGGKPRTASPSSLRHCSPAFSFSPVGPATSGPSFEREHPKPSRHKTGNYILSRLDRVPVLLWRGPRAIASSPTKLVPRALPAANYKLILPRVVVPW